MVHVDVVGAFYDIIRDHFMTCTSIEDDDSKKIIVANKFFEYAPLVVNKASCILYFDGSPTVECTFGSTTGTFRKLENQDNLEIIISKYLISPNYQQYQKIMKDIGKLLYITEEIKSVLRQVAFNQGWNVFVSISEAEVEIGCRGGIVLSNDSDTLFYPKIKTAIRSTAPCIFDVFHK